MSQAELLTPAELGDLAAALAGMTPRSRLLAGGTDLVNAMRRGECRPDLIVDLSGMRELAAVRLDDGVLRVGAMATFSQLQTDPVVRQCAACLGRGGGPGRIDADPQHRHHRRQRRERLAVRRLDPGPHGARRPRHRPGRRRTHVEQTDPRSRRRASADEPCYRRSDHRLHLRPPRGLDERSVFVKIGSRSAVTVARLSAAVVVRRTTRPTGPLSAARVALGAVGETAFRDATVEASLEGRPADEGDGAAGSRRPAPRRCARLSPADTRCPTSGSAALGLAYDAWNGLALSPACEPVWD